MSHLLEDLRYRGLFHQVSGDPDGAELGRHLDTPGRSVYAGFDPTRDSLTIGNLLPIILLRRFQRAGHRPVVVMGGGTGLIGDPSGKESERPVLSREQIAHNVEGQRRIMEKMLDFGGAHPTLLLDNLSWLGSISYLDMLRDVGKHFSVNMMIQKDSVRERLNSREQGISYTEFSYMLLQAYDFLHLFDTHGVTVQVGGSDQWGNIVAGVELIRKKRQGEAFAWTIPLLTKSDGGKFGKTESGAVWLTADRTSPYAFYQFWLNTGDADVLPFLKIFTFLERERIEEIASEHAGAPERRVAQRALAEQVTLLVHDESALEQAKRASEALFSGDVSGLDAATLAQVFEDAPASQHQRSLLAGEGVELLELLVATKLVSSKREARQMLESGAISLNGARVGLDHRVTERDLLHGSMSLLRRGKKNWHVARWL
ncbi:MAG TPA: tyrosine--tRNA ligase [Polyangiaceae bacterium]|nr:tyrosine--tRNA ligase [Polyangiaceae bacterium]